MDYHTTYRGPEGQTTEWDDIQIKLGNKTPRPKREKAPKFEGEREEAKDGEWIKRLDEGELSDAEEDLEDDRALQVLRYAGSLLIQILRVFLSLPSPSLAHMQRQSHQTAPGSKEAAIIWYT